MKRVMRDRPLVVYGKQDSDRDPCPRLPPREARMTAAELADELEATADYADACHLQQIPIDLLESHVSEMREAARALRDAEALAGAVEAFVSARHYGLRVRDAERAMREALTAFRGGEEG